MGVVYRAYDRILEEEVALKVLRPDVAGSPDLTRRFRSEIRLARRVRHPNVCAIHEYGEQGSLRYIAMEFVQGVDLRRILLEGGPLDPLSAVEVACHVAAGLQAIHDVGIVHRDLKSSNIMRDAKGVIRVMDFGIAKELNAATHATATGLVVGTPEYMSPEQARGEPIDFRSDVYSLGIVTYEMLAGSVPFRGTTPVATILKHLTEPPPLEKVPSLARFPGLRDVLACALAKAAADRFPRADALAEALRAAVGATPAGARGALGPTAMLPGKLPETASLVTPVPTPAGRAAVAAPRTRGPAATAVARWRDRWRSGPTVIRFRVAALAVAAVAVAALWSARPARSPLPVASAMPTPTASPPTESPPASSVAGTLAAPARPDARGASASPAAGRAPSPRREPRPTPAAATPAPAAATASPQAPGRLTLVTRPYWAYVRIDGRETGTTPCVVSLAPGLHTIVLEHAGYRPIQRTVSVDSAQATKLDVDFTVVGIRAP
jgi:serine/threonine-protein kinase